MNEAIYLGVGVVLGAGVTYFLLRQRNNAADVFRHHLEEASEKLALIAKEKLSSEKEIIKTDFDGKKDQIKALVDEIRRELNKTDERLIETGRRQVESFSSLKQELEAYKQLTGELRGSTEELRKVLSNNQLRGAFGEQVAENLLKMAGFVIGQDYVVNQATETGPTRPDFCLMLPDGTKINIDVKFPYSALQKATSSEDKVEKKRHTEQFARDVREKVKQVTTRDYIAPENGTVDFVILFIPNEMIFSFIYEQLPEVWEEAMRKKVVLAGPFSFTAVLRLVKQAHSNFKFQQNIHGIISLIQRFRTEYEKFSTELDTLGSRLESTAKQFQVVSTTRSRQLGRVIDQIDNEQLPEASVSAQQNLLDN